MAKKAKTGLTIKPAGSPVTSASINASIHVDARIAVGMFFTLTGTILAAFGFSTREQMGVYAKSLGLDANLWWGLVLLVFGIAMLIFGRRGQMKTGSSQ